MREADINRKLFSTGHYNIIAKQFREALAPQFEKFELHQLSDTTKAGVYIYASTVLTDLALSMATRFLADNDQFSPERFLDACSPDKEKYPLSDLWEGVQNGSN